MRISVCNGVKLQGACGCVAGACCKDIPVEQEFIAFGSQAKCSR